MDRPGASANATTVALGHVNGVTNGVGAQDLSITTNAALGFTIYARSTGTMDDGRGHTIAATDGRATCRAAGHQSRGACSAAARLAAGERAARSLE